MSSNAAGKMITAAGFAILAISATADLIGLGQSPDEIGYRQILGVILGAAVIALGFYASRDRSPQE